MMIDILIFLAGCLVGMIVTLFVSNSLSRLSGDLFVDVNDNNYMWLSLTESPEKITQQNTVIFKVKVLKK